MCPPSGIDHVCRSGSYVQRQVHPGYGDRYVYNIKSALGLVTDMNTHPSAFKGRRVLYLHTEDVQVGCRELWAKRYISDGLCTSVKPLREVVCAGHCLPIRDLPWYAEFVALWTKSRL
ncbi:hypothetical protein ACOMHN_061336 [Nucella lapillus]